LILFREEWRCLAGIESAGNTGRPAGGIISRGVSLILDRHLWHVSCSHIHNVACAWTLPLTRVAASIVGGAVSHPMEDAGTIVRHRSCWECD
jgi:hypothetical protein